MKVKDSGGLSPKQLRENLIVFPLFCVFFLLVCNGLHGGHGIFLGNFWVFWLGPKILSMEETSHIPPGQKGKLFDSKVPAGRDMLMIC